MFSELGAATVGVGLGKIMATVVWAARSAGMGVAWFEEASGSMPMCKVVVESSVCAWVVSVCLGAADVDGHDDVGE